MTAVYGKAVLDGVEVDVANWLVEPPGLFMGRGLHPLRGKWKFRVYPQDVTLNMEKMGLFPKELGGILFMTTPLHGLLLG